MSVGCNNCGHKSVEDAMFIASMKATLEKRAVRLRELLAKVPTWRQELLRVEAMLREAARDIADVLPGPEKW